MKQFIDTSNRKLKIVIDAGNGMAGHFLPAFKELLGDKAEIIPLFWELDGNFPNHPPDPMKEGIPPSIVADGHDIDEARDMHHA